MNKGAITYHDCIHRPMRHFVIYEVTIRAPLNSQVISSTSSNIVTKVLLPRIRECNVLGASIYDNVRFEGDVGPEDTCIIKYSCML